MSDGEGGLGPGLGKKVGVSYGEGVGEANEVEFGQGSVMHFLKLLQQ